MALRFFGLAGLVADFVLGRLLEPLHLVFGRLLIFVEFGLVQRDRSARARSVLFVETANQPRKYPKAAMATTRKTTTNIRDLMTILQKLVKQHATKKADVAEHPEEFRHVGLLTNEPLGTAGLLSI